MWRTDDPLEDFNRKDAEYAEELEKLPTCEYCGHKIEDEYLFDVEGTIICEECMKKHFRKSVEFYVD